LWQDYFFRFVQNAASEDNTDFMSAIPSLYFQLYPDKENLDSQRRGKKSQYVKSLRANEWRKISMLGIELNRNVLPRLVGVAPLPTTYGGPLLIHLKTLAIVDRRPDLVYLSFFKLHRTFGKAIQGTVARFVLNLLVLATGKAFIRAALAFMLNDNAGESFFSLGSVRDNIHYLPIRQHPGDVVRIFFKRLRNREMLPHHVDLLACVLQEFLARNELTPDVIAKEEWKLIEEFQYETLNRLRHPFRCLPLKWTLIEQAALQSNRSILWSPRIVNIVSCVGEMCPLPDPHLEENAISCMKLLRVTQNEHQPQVQGIGREARYEKPRMGGKGKTEIDKWEEFLSANAWLVINEHKRKIQFDSVPDNGTGEITFGEDVTKVTLTLDNPLSDQSFRDTLSIAVMVYLGEEEAVPILPPVICAGWAEPSKE